MSEKITKPRGYKTIKLPCSEEKHAELLIAPQTFRRYVDAQYREHPELFPSALQDGYESHGFTEPSKKNEWSANAPD